MPTYDYSCTCGEVFEVEHRITEDPEIVCDNCGDTAERMISDTASTGFVLKGKGWFNNGGY
tara:strand:+ start:4429 stop:4611 length:183 start_codon:yes stop_codon:yes gene_type:complete